MKSRTSCPHAANESVEVGGIPSPKYGEEVGAFIKVKEGQTLTEEEIKLFCRGQIARYKIPKYIFFVDSYPMTASGKIQKYKLKDWAWRCFGTGRRSDLTASHHLSGNKRQRPFRIL